MKNLVAYILIFFLVLLSACSGGDGGSAPAPSPEPVPTPSPRLDPISPPPSKLIQDGLGHSVTVSEECLMPNLIGSRKLSSGRGGVTEAAISYDIVSEGILFSVNDELCDYSNLSIQQTSSEICVMDLGCGSERFRLYADVASKQWLLDDSSLNGLTNRPWNLGAFTGTVPSPDEPEPCTGSNCPPSPPQPSPAAPTFCGTGEDALGWKDLVVGTYLWRAPRFGSYSKDKYSAVMLRPDCRYCEAGSLDDEIKAGVFDVGIDGTWEILDHRSDSSGSYTRVKLGASVYRIWESHYETQNKVIGYTKDGTFHEANGTWFYGKPGYELEYELATEIFSQQPPVLVKLDSGYDRDDDPRFSRNSSDGSVGTMDGKGFKCADQP